MVLPIFLSDEKSGCADDAGIAAQSGDENLNFWSSLEAIILGGEFLLDRVG